MCVIVGDGTFGAGAVELQLGQVDVAQGGDGEHQSHLCLLTLKLYRQAAADF